MPVPTYNPAVQLSLAGQEAGGGFGEVGENDVGVGTADGGERFDPGPPHRKASVGYDSSSARSSASVCRSRIDSARARRQNTFLSRWTFSIATLSNRAREMT